MATDEGGCLVFCDCPLLEKVHSHAYLPQRRPRRYSDEPRIEHVATPEEERWWEEQIVPFKSKKTRGRTITRLELGDEVTEEAVERLEREEWIS